jgi:hypothetical protein
MKKIYIFILSLVVFSSFAFALIDDTRELTITNLIPGLTKMQADILYCQQNGNCNISNLNVINTTVTNQNVTGMVNAYGYTVNGTNINYFYWSQNTNQYSLSGIKQGNYSLNTSGTIGFSEAIGIKDLLWVNHQNLFADGFLLEYWYDFEMPFDDWLVFHKTDGNDAAPDGGIAFMMSNSSGDNRTVLKLDGYGNANFTDYNINTLGNETASYFCDWFGNCVSNLSLLNPDLNIYLKKFNDTSSNQSLNGTVTINKNIIYLNPSDTIQSIINSITDSSCSNRYILLIPPKTYNEQITLKEGISLKGMGIDKTIIANVGSGANDFTTIFPEDCLTISDMTIVATGTGIGIGTYNHPSLAGITYRVENAKINGTYDLIYTDQANVNVYIGGTSGSFQGYTNYDGFTNLYPTSKMFIDGCTITMNIPDDISDGAFRVDNGYMRVKDCYVTGFVQTSGTGDNSAVVKIDRGTIDLIDVNSNISLPNVADNFYGVYVFGGGVANVYGGSFRSQGNSNPNYDLMNQGGTLNIYGTYYTTSFGTIGGNFKFPNNATANQLYESTSRVCTSTNGVCDSRYNLSNIVLTNQSNLFNRNQTFNFPFVNLTISQKNTSTGVYYPEISGYNGIQQAASLVGGIYLRQDDAGNDPLIYMCNRSLANCGYLDYTPTLGGGISWNPAQTTDIWSWNGETRYATNFKQSFRAATQSIFSPASSQLRIVSPTLFINSTTVYINATSLLANASVTGRGFTVSDTSISSNAFVSSRTLNRTGGGSQALFSLTYNGEGATAANTLATRSIVTLARRVTSGATDSIIGGDFGVSRPNDATQASGVLLIGLRGSVADTGIYNKSGGGQTINVYGIDSAVTFSPIFDIGAGNTDGYTGIANRLFIAYAPTSISGNLGSPDITGYALKDNGIAVSTSTPTLHAYYNELGYGNGFTKAYFLDNVAQADSNIGYDGSKVFFGTYKNASIYYQNNTLNINSSVTNITGNVNIGGKVNAQRFFASEDFPHMYGDVTVPQTITAINTWYNMTFNASVSLVEGNFTFLYNTTLLINETGDYLIEIGTSIYDTSASAGNNFAVRVAKNNLQLNGSYRQLTTLKQNAVTPISKLVYTQLQAGDILQFQYIADSTSISINSPNTWNTGLRQIAYGWIERID